jgi:hypothetical protein
MELVGVNFFTHFMNKNNQSKSAKSVSSVFYIPSVFCKDNI